MRVDLGLRAVDLKRYSLALPKLPPNSLRPLRDEALQPRDLLVVGRSRMCVHRGQNWTNLPLEFAHSICDEFQSKHIRE